MSEKWVEFEPGRDSGGVGVLGVRFLCESDGAVAPLRGLFPTVTFRGQATEVVQREPRVVAGFDPTRVDVVEGSDPWLVFTVVIEPALGEEVTLSYMLVLDETTAEPEDFGVSGFDALDAFRRDDGDLVGTVVVPAGVGSAEIRLGVVDDVFFEGDERLVLGLTGAAPPGVEFDDNRIRAVGVIGDDDPEPFLQIMKVDAEADEGETLSFVVRVGDEFGAEVDDIAAPFSVRVSTLDDSAARGSVSDWPLPGGVCPWATAGEDYTAVGRTLHFAPGGGLSVRVPVVTLDDVSSPVGEPTEYVRLVLSDASEDAPDLHGARNMADGRIFDDEATVLSVADVTPLDAVEGDSVVFRVTLDRAPAADVTLVYDFEPDDRLGARHATPGVCGADGVDYLGAGGEVVVRASFLEATFEVPTCDDVLVERGETFWVGLSRAADGGEVVVPEGAGAWGTVRDDDIAVVSIVADPPGATGTEGQADPLGFTVGLTVGGVPAQLTEDITVDYAIRGHGTDPATGPGETDADYSVTLDTATPPELAGPVLGGTLTFTAAAPGAPAVTEHVFEARLLPDYLPEVSEAFQLDLFNLVDPVGAAVFEDTDADPVTDDSFAVGTIEDDAPPVLSVDGFRGDEGTNQDFTVRLDIAPRAGETVEVDYEITGAGSSPATDSADFSAAPGGSLSGTLAFGAGTTVRTVAVALLRDTVREDPETLEIALSNAQRAYLDSAAATATGTIVDVDPPYLFVGNTSAREGEPLTFTVSLCNPYSPGRDVTVDYETLARSAAKDLDFVPAPSGSTLTFPDTLAARPVSVGCGAGVAADAKSLTVEVATKNDGVEESDEEVHLVLSGQPDDVALGKGIGVGRIVNVSAATVRVTDPVAVEGSPLGFTISLVDKDGNPAVITEDVTVFYATADRTATAGADYTPVPAAPAPCLSAAPPSTCPSATFVHTGDVRGYTVEVRTATDRLDEDDETVALVLRLAAGTANAGLGDTEGTGTITDADPPSLIIDDVVVQEGNTATFTVTLVDSDGNPATTSEVVTVDAATEDGSATAPGDYTAVSSPLTIPAGDTSVPVEVATSIDNINEPPETFRVVLSGARNAKVDKAVAVGTINEPCVVEAPVPADLADNMPPTIALHDVAVLEGASGFAWLASFGRPMCVGPDIAMQVLSGGGFGTATCGLHRVPGGDFPPLGGSCQPPLSASGRLIQSVTTVPTSTVRHGRLWDDDLDEDNEWFTIRIRWGPDMPGRFPKAGSDWVSARVTIIDDDPPPHLSIADSSAEEGVLMAFTINLSSESGRPVTVEYRTVPESGAATGSTDRDAAAGVDYTAVGWTSVTLIPGVTSQNFGVTTFNDGAADSGETFLVEVRAPVSSDPANPAPPLNAAIVDGVAVGTILEGNLPELRIRDASADENSIMEFLVELSEPATQAVTVDYSTVERPANLYAADASVDYTGVSAFLEIPVGATTPIMPISVVILADSVTEVDETFLVELSNPSGAELADPSAVGTINGDTTCVDTTVPGTLLPIVTVDSPTALESDGEMIFTLTITDPICHRNVFTPYATAVPPGAADRALPDIDFHSSSQDLGIFYLPRLTTQVSFPVYLINDTIDEPDETLAVDIISADTLGDATATGVIVDDDQASLSVASDSGPEGGFLNFTISLDRPSTRDVTVGYTTEDASRVSAAAGVDYRARLGTATIAAGELSATVAVFAPQDELDEDPETFLLRLSNPTGGAQLLDPNAVAVGTITDDDAPPNARVSNASTNEGGTLEFAVTLSAPSGREVRIPVATRDGTARAADGDYETLASTHVVFAPGATRQILRVQTLDDDAVESSEVVWLDLGPVGDGTAVIGDGLGRGVIRDVSDRSLSVSDAFVFEGGTLAFEVGFAEGPSSRDVTVRYQTRAGTAAAGDDYDGGFEAVSRELRIVAGDTSATVSVSTVSDTLDEDNESLELVLSDPAGAVIVVGAASGTIIDDDPLPELRVGNTEASEGVGASAVFTLSLSEASGRDVTVAYSTEDGTAAAGGDYTAVSDGEVVIAAGDRQATVGVALVDDDVAEDVETFRLVVSAAANASRGDSVGVATVTDDDGQVQILVDDPAAVYEGDGASAVFTVRLSRAHPTEAVTVDFATADGTAVAGADYTHTSDTLTFAATETAKTVSVPLINDDVAETAETFRLVLTSPGSNAELGDGEATVLIRDDDGLPTVSVADAATRTEGATASFTVTLSRAVPREVTVEYATRADPTAAAETAAVAGQDYTTTSGTVTFAARATEATVTVPLLGDALDEHTETFWLRLASPTGATIADGTATGTIADDDPLPEIAIADAGATEGAPVSFEVRLTPFSGRTVTVPWATEARPPGAGAASPGADYTAASGTLTLAPGTTTARVEVATLPDGVSEADETFLVQLGTPANAALDDSTAVGAIFDDDGLPRVFIADTTVDEDDGPAIFTVTLSHPSSQPVTVEYTTADGTAEDPDDYAPDLVRTLTIPATFTGGEISVFIADDDEGEGTETFTITLTDPVNAVIAEGAGTAVGYIVDDEGQPRLTVADAAECEDGSSTADCEVRICRIIFPRPIEQLSACAAMLLLPGACQPGMCTGDGIIEFSVQLSHASSEETSVRYTIFERGAVDPRDYVASSGTLRIPAGDVSAAIPVVLVDDAIDEEEVETFLLRLDDPVGVELVVAEAVGTILDDDLPPRVAAEPFDAFSTENDGFAYHRVTLSDPSDLTATMDYVFVAVDDRSEFAGIDPTPGTLTFAPGVVEQTIEVPLIDNNVATFTHGDGVSWRYATTSYWLNLNNRVNALTGVANALGVVWDDETPPYVESVAAQDTLEGAGAATFTIALNRFSDTAVTATYQTVDGIAAAGIDYTAAEATVTFPPGTITATVTVAITDDTDIENDESFTLRIIDDARNSNLTYLAQPLSDGHGTGFGSVLIIDDDSMPEVSVAGTRANEDAGTMTLWVSLSRASATAVTVDFATADGTATAGSDYTETDGTLTIPAGATGAGVSVTILDDTDDTESDETFTLNLSNPAGATIAGGSTTATATIIEDANLPTLTMGDASQTENIALGSPFIGFRPRIVGQATRTITVDWQVVEVPSLGDEAATIGADFLASPSSGTFTILPRSTPQRPVPVFRIVPDVIPERDDRFQVILSNPRGARLGNTRVWGTIRNDDVPIVSVADVEASESDGAVVFTLRLHEPGLDPASLRYTTMVRPSEGDRAASPGDDYTTAWGTVNIPAGDTTATITVPILADSVDEADETFLLVLTNPDTLEFRDAVAVGTIVDDDPGFWIEDDRSVRENAGSMVFTVQRDHTSTDDVAVEYRFGSWGSAVGGADCAVDGVDFVWPSGTSAPGTVTMPAAGRAVAISVEVCDDDDAEGRENLLIELTNVTGRKTTGVGTIIDDRD